MAGQVGAMEFFSPFSKYFAEQTHNNGSQIITSTCANDSAATS
jgi:hypothetical protein